MDNHFFILLQAILRLILLCKAKGRSGKILDIVCTDTFYFIELPANNLSNTHGNHQFVLLKVDKLCR